MSFHTLPTIDEDMALACAARAAHEVHRTFAVALGEPTVPTWDLLPEVIQKAVLYGVIAVRNGANPRQWHDAWVFFHQDRGWRWGETQDAEQKTHPCLIAWECLPESQRRKDELFVSTVLGMLLACGARVYVANAA